MSLNPVAVILRDLQVDARPVQNSDHDDGENRHAPEEAHQHRGTWRFCVTLRKVLVGNPKSEIRNPKEARSPNSEIQRTPEARTPKAVPIRQRFGFRISNFFRTSDFGLRILAARFRGAKE